MSSEDKILLNATFYYCTPEGKFEKKNIVNENGYDGLTKVINDVLVSSDIDNKVDFVWLDLISLMDNSVMKKLLPQLDYDKNSIPTVFIGSQSIQELIEKPEYLFHKKLTQLDNNIWTYYIGIQNKTDFQNQLKEILKDIINNYERGLYELSVSHEYLDYYRRLCGENYLTGGHSSQVLPQIHTSKTIINKFIKEDITKIKNLIGDKEHTVKVLLVDDFGNENLNKKGEDKSPDNEKNEIKIQETNTEKYTSKANHLKNLWNTFNENEKLNIKLEVKVLSSPEVDKLENEYFDIYLIDYNFNQEKSGVDFLKELITKRSEYKEWANGPFNTPWIIPITSFSNAFIDEMRNEGLSFISPDYHISRGADFIATPVLFLNFFTKMLLEIIERAKATEKNIEKIKVELNKARDWDYIRKNQGKYETMFKEHIERRKDVNYFLNAEHGILKSLKGDEIDIAKFKQQMNFYEQLLYNLAYRNFEGNEEIIIFHDLLKQV